MFNFVFIWLIYTQSLLIDKICVNKYVFNFIERFVTDLTVPKLDIILYHLRMVFFTSAIKVDKGCITLSNTMCALQNMITQYSRQNGMTCSYI